MNILFQYVFQYIYVCISAGFIPRSRVAGIHMFCFGGEHEIIFQNDYTNLHCYQQCLRVAAANILLSDRYGVVLHCGFNFHFIFLLQLTNRN